MLLVITTLAAATISLIISWIASGLTQPVTLMDGVSLRLSQNSGIAFSLSIPSPWEEVLIITALAVVGVFAFRSARNTLTSVGFGLIIGGAIANLLDRLPDGFVTDYFSVGTFPIFNAADSCITVGAALLFIEMWLTRPKKAHSTNSQ